MDLTYLSSDELKIGILKSVENSKDLIDDGNILFNLERFPRAFTMYQFSNEELGKAMMFFQVLISRELREEIDYKKYSKKIRSHQSKHRLSGGIMLSTLSMLYSKKFENKKGFLKEFLLNIKLAKDYDELKNNSLYVNLNENKFKTPFQVIDKDFVEQVKLYSELNFKVYSYKIEESLSLIKEIANEIQKPNYDDEFMKDLKDLIFELK